VNEVIKIIGNKNGNTARFDTTLNKGWIEYKTGEVSSDRSIKNLNFLWNVVNKTNSDKKWEELKV
jgi:hypothetical protein